LGVVFGVITLTFVLLHLAPGDPVDRLLGPAATALQRDATRHALGLDQPLATQYLAWLGRAVRGDFGTSLVQGRPIATMLAEAWPATALLVFLSLGASYVLGIALGLIQANIRRGGVDAAISAGSVALNAIPGYWLGLVMVMVFTWWLRWLPAFGAA
jgi:peptide/nickel transport system permease protein